ncbi:MAG TPA: endonuclease/exonuclease/phosphatase family protein [Fimbriiglobus sp.]|nr:endonuclease/exonuclease/phosphatase family protein [Fimbriiglobus sp.]
MARRPRQDRLVREAVQSFLALPRKYQIGLAVLVLLGVAVWFTIQWTRSPYGNQPPVTGTNPDGSGTYLFCFWNVENLFDDADDDRRTVDEEYDNSFAHDAGMRQEKYDHIASALLALNGGHGPDVIACVEVESVRAAELLRDALNRKLDPAWQYTQVAMRNLDAGRHIAPCLITRLNVAPAETRMHGRLLRILEVHLAANGHDLTVIASHWTSQLRQRDGSDGDEGRANYARTIAEVYRDAARARPDVDLLVCGDFNDTPDSDPVVHELRATGDRSLVVPAADPPRLLDLLAGKSPQQFGTLWYRKPLIYDHVCVSPGMLDPAGWSCDPESVRVPTDGLTRGSRREPWRFGNPTNPPTGGRGYSDHFPVLVTLRVAPKAD